MRIMVTGAAGGIGSTLSYSLYKKGHCLTLVDNLRNGYIENLKINGEYYGNFYELDINSDSFRDLVSKLVPDVIIHLAAITSLPDCEVNYRECIRVNVEGTASVLGAASKYGVKKVIFGGTSAVYENTKLKENGFEENDEINPRLFYSLSKKMAEEICTTYRENYGLDVTILRFFNVFGPRQDIHRKNPPIINYVVREFLEEKIPILHSDGEQIRDYVYVDDVVDLITKCIEYPKTDEYVFNVSTGTITSVKDIVLTVSKTLLSNVKEIYRESNKLWDSYPEIFSGINPLKKEIVEKETNKKSIGNNSKTREQFNWKPKCNILDLIRETTIEIKNRNK